MNPEILERARTALHNMEQWIATMTFANSVMEECRDSLAELIKELE